MTIWQSYLFTFKKIVSIRPVISTLILAIILYGFFYPAAYKTQFASQLPIVVVDLDQSSLSQRLIQKLTTLQSIKIIERTANFKEAEELVQTEQASAIFLIPNHLQSAIAHGDSSGLALYLSGAYLLRTKEIGSGFSGAIKDTIEQEISPVFEGLNIEPPQHLFQYPLYNPTSGYGNYIFPAVSTLIVQQTLLMGIGFLITYLKLEKFKFTVQHLTGICLAFMTVGCFTLLYYFGFVFWLQDYPRVNNLPLMLLAVPIYIGAVVMLGLLLASFFDRPERVAQVLTFSSVPFFFLTGLSWPLEAMPRWMSSLAWVLPSTAGVRQFVQINQMGANFTQILPNLLILIGLAIIFGVLGFRRVYMSTNHS